MLPVIEVGSPKASDKISLWVGLQETAMDFFFKIITQNSWKFFNYEPKFNSFKPKYVIFRILELYSSTKEIPLDLDIPQSLDSLKLVGRKIGLGTKIKATNPSVDIMSG